MPDNTGHEESLEQHPADEQVADALVKYDLHRNPAIEAG